MRNWNVIISRLLTATYIGPDYRLELQALDASTREVVGNVTLHTVEWTLWCWTFRFVPMSSSLDSTP